jgi:hypothetical protein
VLTYADRARAARVSVRRHADRGGGKRTNSRQRSASRTARADTGYLKQFEVRSCPMPATCADRLPPEGSDGSGVNGLTPGPL